MARNYTGSTREDAAEILANCALDGHSTGWSGSIEDREKLVAVLAPYGVRYTDDLRGVWKPGMGSTEARYVEAIRTRAKKHCGRDDGAPTCEGCCAMFAAVGLEIPAVRTPLNLRKVRDLLRARGVECQFEMTGGGTGTLCAGKRVGDFFPVIIGPADFSTGEALSDCVVAGDEDRPDAECTACSHLDDAAVAALVIERIGAAS